MPTKWSFDIDWRAILELCNRFNGVEPKDYGIAVVNRKHKLRGGWKRR